MLSLIRKTLQRALSLNEYSSRIQKLEEKIKKLEKIADENESLWQMLEEQR